MWIADRVAHGDHSCVRVSLWRRCVLGEHDEFTNEDRTRPVFIAIEWANYAEGSRVRLARGYID